MRGPVSETPVPTEASELAKAKACFQEVKDLIKVHEKTLKDNQSAADKAADASRIEKLERRVQERLYGNPDDRGSEREAMMHIAEELAVTSGGKSYENLKSCYQDLIRLAIALCYMLSAYFRTSDRIAGGLSFLSNLITDRFSSPGMTVALHEDFTKASTCDDTGKVTCSQLPLSLFISETPEDLVRDLSNMNEFLVRAFLLSNGYEPDDDDVYSHKNGTLLTPAKFNEMKNDPHDGLKAFAKKHLHVGVTSEKMGLAVAAAPKSVEPQSPEPSVDTPRFRP